MAATLSGSSANSTLCLAVVAAVLSVLFFFAEVLVFLEALFFEATILFSCGLNEPVKGIRFPITSCRRDKSLVAYWISNVGSCQDLYLKIIH